ncbi:MAG: DNA-directed RNA polymerase subunit omega [Candidatus Koribacter versatilis]|uniref:DNA-directed RNA polymerase subunit omega n=1 Tax=Candidatus Korobacter versatilis TaxID=658062 RepID=A0A932EPP6_9BACT|nr:DNA-directed RNA polymerase subunit omega [Candidatus Koribacter versatilis]
MRSDLVFPAVKTVRNRYELCQLASKATRRFHKPSLRIQDTMNDILTKVGAAVAEPETVMGRTEVLAESHKRAA